MKNKKLGLQKERVIYTPLRGIENFSTVKRELLNYSGVESVSATLALPDRIMNSTSGASWEGKEEGSTFLIHYNAVAYDMVETFGIEIVEGRSLSAEYSDEDNFGILVNEQAVREMGIENPVGKKFSLWGSEGTIVGVMKDFHFKSLHNPIEPIMLTVMRDYIDYMVVKIKGENQAETIAYLNSTMEKFTTGRKPEFRFFEDRYNTMYNAEQQIEKTLKIFTGLAIFVACLGLFGLSTFMIQQRTKEVGIRKVLGASISGILIILSKEFTKWVIIANLIACPIAYFVMKKLLQNFAYRINIGLSVFILTIGLSVILALITVSYQVIRAANGNPVNSLSYE